MTDSKNNDFINAGYWAVIMTTLQGVAGKATEMLTQKGISKAEEAFDKWGGEDSPLDEVGYAKAVVTLRDRAPRQGETEETVKEDCFHWIEIKREMDSLFGDGIVSDAKRGEYQTHNRKNWTAMSEGTAPLITNPNGGGEKIPDPTWLPYSCRLMLLTVEVYKEFVRRGASHEAAISVAFEVLRGHGFKIPNERQIERYKKLDNRLRLDDLPGKLQETIKASVAGVKRLQLEQKIPRLAMKASREIDKRGGEAIEAVAKRIATKEPKKKRFWLARLLPGFGN